MMGTIQEFYHIFLVRKSMIRCDMTIDALCIGENTDQLDGNKQHLQVLKANVTVYESTKRPNAFFLHGSRHKDSMAACLCTVALVVRTGWSPVSLMTRARHVHALSSPSTVLNSLGSLARVLLITGVEKTMGAVGYHIEEGI
jgi:hypothetical protein